LLIQLRSSSANFTGDNTKQLLPVGSWIISLRLKEVGAFVITHHLPDYRWFRIGGAISPFHMHIRVYAFVAFKANDKAVFPGDSMKYIYIYIEAAS